MSQFSDLLREHTKNSGISHRKLAAVIGMDRTLLQHYLSGSRVPRHYKEIENLCSGLMLSVSQKQNLLDAYRREVYGSRKYDSFLHIKAFYEKVWDFMVSGEFAENTDEAWTTSVEELPKEMTVRGVKQVKNAIVRFVQRLSRRSLNTVKVRMMIQPEQKELLNLLLMVCCRLNVEIEHIICLDANCSDNDNFSALFSILPFEINDIFYQARYYYDFPEVHMKQMNLLQNMILMDDYVFLCNRELDECLVLGRSESVVFFERQYQKIRNSTKRLEFSADQVSHMTGYSETTLDQSIAIELGAFPCIMSGLDMKMLQKYLVVDWLDKEAVAVMMDNFIRQLNVNIKLHNCFSESEFRRFLETGEIAIYPENIYRRPDVKDRLLIVRRLIELGRKGQYFPYICNEEYFSMQNPMLMEYKPSGTLCVRWKENGRLEKAVIVTEPGMGSTVAEFIDFALKNDWVYDVEESLERMERVWREIANG